MTNLICQRNVPQDAVALGESNGAFSNEVTVKITGQELKSGILSEANLDKVYIVPSKIQSKQLAKLRAKLNKRSGRP